MLTCKHKFSNQNNLCVEKKENTSVILTYKCSDGSQKQNCGKIKDYKTECPNKSYIKTVENVTILLDEDHCRKCICTELKTCILRKAGAKCTNNQCELLKDFQTNPCAKVLPHFAVYYSCVPTEYHTEALTAYTLAAVIVCIIAVFGLVITVLVVHRYKNNRSFPWMFMQKSIDKSIESSAPESTNYEEIISDIHMSNPKPDKTQETTRAQKENFSKTSELKTNLMVKTVSEMRFTIDSTKTGYYSVCHSQTTTNDTSSTSNSSVSSIEQQTDPYTETPDYDHINCNRNNKKDKPENNIYSRAIDNNYDTAQYYRKYGQYNTDNYDNVATDNRKNNSKRDNILNI